MLTFLIVRCKCLSVILFGFYLYSLLSVAEDQETGSAFDFLLCRHCGHEVTKSEDVFNKPSGNAMRMRNGTILGHPRVLIQRFINPQGSEFELITSKVADVFVQEQSFSTRSWFSGFLWHVVYCPRCGFHLGWFFEPDGFKDSNNTFFGLILQHLLHQDFADSLLIMPRSYNS